MKRLTLILVLMVATGLVILPGSVFALDWANGIVDETKDPIPELAGMTQEQFAAMFEDDQPVNNPYFPMTDTSTTRIYESDDGEERFELTNTGPGRTILGVQTQTQFDREFEDDELTEETKDYYAQDKFGRVWYFGEDVINYEDDGSTNNDGAWIADGEESLPGWMMKDDPENQLGDNYYQEIAALEEALDEGTIWDLVGTVAVEGGSFDEVLRILEYNPFDEEWEYKYYAKNFGLIKEEENLEVLGGGRFGDPESTYEYVGSVSAAPVPEPGTIFLLGTGIVGLISLGRRKMKK
jgi:hypothetical protein